MNGTKESNFTLQRNRIERLSDGSISNLTLVPADREQQLFNQLIENRQRMIDAVCRQLPSPDTVTGN
jgi:hypothetical protein